MSLLQITQELIVPWRIANYVLILILSLIIIYQAYRGYRRNGSRPLLFLALGVVLLTIAPTVVTIVSSAFVSPATFGSVVSPLTGSIRVAGLISIIYSIYGRR